MAQDESGQNQDFDRKKAETILKILWLTFNNFTMYGTNHQMTKGSCIDLHNKFMDALDIISPLTIHVEEESLFCESWKIERKKFASRLVNRFKSAGIQSVAFEKGLSTEALNLFITMLDDPANFVTVETMKKTFKKKDMSGVRLNFITYRKVQDDEIVVRENSEEFAQMLSVGHIVSQSDSIAKNLRTQITEGGPALLADYLIKIRKRIPHSVIDNKKLPPPNEILETLAALKKGILEDLQTDSTTGIIDNMGKEAVREMDSLADEVIVKIIWEEYRAGLKSPKDLALLVERLIPDAVNLKRLMPRIKEVLLTEGMSLTEYLEMVRGIVDELQGSSLIELLKEAGEEIGVSVGEIVKDLKNNPQAAARLIILASEIRSNLSGSDDEFITTLSKYIERVSIKMMKEEIAGGSEQDRDDIEKTLSRLEHELLKDLGVNGIEPVHTDLIRNLLVNRLPDAVVQLKDEIVREKNTERGSVTATGTGEVNVGGGFSKGVGYGEGTIGEKGITGKVTPEGEKLSLHGAPGGLKDEIVTEGGGGSKRVSVTGTDELNAGTGFSKGVGYGEGTIGEKGITGKVKSASIKSPSLPKDVLRIKDTKKYLQREIWRNNRYKTPFACLSVSIVHINGEEKPSKEKAAGIFSEIFRILSESIRSLDLIGSLGSLADNYLLIILTETTPDGADILRGRLEEKFNNIKINFNDENIVPEVRVSAISYDGEKKPKITAFVRQVKANHKRYLK